MGFSLLWAGAALGQQKTIVADPLTGVALSGYDPVAYFTEGGPREGSPLHTLEWGGAAWYFISAANRDIFERDPEIYAPLFGGHCAMSMARGHLSVGNPLIYRIVQDRVVLFYSIGNREAFDQATANALSRGIANWDALPDHRPQVQSDG